jgi:hypothetical protein
VYVIKNIYVNKIFFILKGLIKEDIIIPQASLINNSIICGAGIRGNNTAKTVPAAEEKQSLMRPQHNLNVFDTAYNIIKSIIKLSSITYSIYTLIPCHLIQRAFFTRRLFDYTIYAR